MDTNPDTAGKRKRETEQAVSNKRTMKRNRKAKSPETKEQHVDAQNDINEDIGRMDSVLLADHMIRSMRRFEPDLTTLELEDQYHVPGNLLFCFLLAVLSEMEATDSKSCQNAQYATLRIGTCGAPQTTWPNILNILQAMELQPSLRMLLNRADVHIPLS